LLTPQDKLKATNYLYDNSNPILKLWAAERLGAPEAELLRLRQDMLAHPDVRYWLERLLHRSEKPMLHGSFDTCLENSMRKAFQFGIREADDERLKAVNDAIAGRLEYQLEHPGAIDPVDYTIMASCLLGMGRQDGSAVAVALERLDSALEFTALGGPNMHTDPAGYPTIPAARRRHPLIHPKFNEGGRYRYPLVYDLFAWANLPHELAIQHDILEKIDAVMRIVLDERYQRLPWGYGLILVPPNKYYGMGWSVHLPRFFAEGNRITDDGSVWWAEAMAHFPAAVRSGWFRGIVEHLDAFRTNDGFWKFPAAYLGEAGDKYFVGGGHMGLGENRRDRDALKLLSTAWMLRIDDAAGKTTVPEA
jgi:hypothetical protein